MITAIVSIYYYIVVLVWSVVYFLFLCVLFLLTVLLDPQRVVLHKASAVWAKSIFWLNPLWRMKVRGKENIDPRGKYVITVNHQSMVDIPIMYVLPRLNFKWVAKSFIYKWPLFGAVLWMHGDIVIKEGSVRTARAFMGKGLKHLAAGTSVIMFPEGTRSKDGEIHKFRDGAFALAKEAGVGILPCVINGAKGFVKGWRVQKTTFEVSIMPPVPAEEVAAHTERETMEKVREASVAELAALRVANPLRPISAADKGGLR